MIANVGSYLYVAERTNYVFGSLKVKKNRYETSCL